MLFFDKESLIVGYECKSIIFQTIMFRPVHLFQV